MFFGKVNYERYSNLCIHLKDTKEEDESDHSTFVDKIIKVKRAIDPNMYNCYKLDHAKESFEAINSLVDNLIKKYEKKCKEVDKMKKEIEVKD
jgi:hypothetical protein